MELTAAICTHNPRSRNLARALDALEIQLAEVTAGELLIIDNNSSFPVRLLSVVSHRDARVISEPTPGLTAAREAAFRNARGDIVVFVDDDNVLQPGYLRSVVDTFARDPDLGALGGRIEPEYEVSPAPWFAEFAASIAIRDYPPGLRVETVAPPISDFFPIGAGLAVRRSLGLAYLADARATTAVQGRRGTALSSGEDLDLDLFILESGKKLCVTGDIALTHIISRDRLTPDYMRRLSKANMRSHEELESKWAQRLGTGIVTTYDMPPLELVGRLIASTILSPLSPRYGIKRVRYVAVLRRRLRERLG